jgi:DNA processing protein
VLAVPGEITSALSSGTNALIRTGATPVTCVRDVLEALGIEPARPERTALDPDTERILAAVAAGPAGADEVARSTGLRADVVAAALTRLELEGLVSSDGGVFRGVMPTAG